MQLKNSTVLITGGASGIGLELVKQLTEKRARIVVTERNTDALNETKGSEIRYSLLAEIRKHITRSR